MIKYITSAALSLALAAPAMADSMSPAGQWLVKDKTAHIRIVACDNAMWGVVSWAKTSGNDVNNPDAAKRERPILGMPILLDMQPVGENNWDGQIYNGENGKTYSGSIALQSGDILHIKGCLLKGVMCGGENWTRLEAEPDQESDDAICQRVALKNHTE